jgi:hypothetical protein
MVRKMAQSYPEPRLRWTCQNAMEETVIERDGNCLIIGSAPRRQARLCVAGAAPLATVQQAKGAKVGIDTCPSRTRP